MSPIIQMLIGCVEDGPMSREEIELLDALDPYYEQIEGALSKEFLFDFNDACTEAWSVEVKDFFERGFRLGVELMLDILRQDGGRG